MLQHQPVAEENRAKRARLLPARSKEENDADIAEVATHHGEATQTDTQRTHLRVPKVKIVHGKTKVSGIGIWCYSIHRASLTSMYCIADMATRRLSSLVSGAAKEVESIG